MFRRILAALLTGLLLAAAQTPVLAEGTRYSAYWIIEDSDTRLLTEEELWQYTRETLRFIRNEILARAGYAFETPKFYNYFNAKPWYIAGGYGTTRSLNQVSWDNITTVKAVERAMDRQKTENPGGIDISAIIAYQNSAGGYGDLMSYGNNRGSGSGLTVPETDPAYDQTDPALLPAPVTPQPHYIYNTQYIIPDSDARRLTESELWAYSREALRYIRNEILARHGYAFGTSKFAEYFGSKAWYVPGGYENAVLTATEWDNIALIKKVERAMDALGTENAGYLDITTIRLNQQNNLCPGQ